MVGGGRAGAAAALGGFGSHNGRFDLGGDFPVLSLAPSTSSLVPAATGYQLSPPPVSRPDRRLGRSRRFSKGHARSDPGNARPMFFAGRDET